MCLTSITICAFTTDPTDAPLFRLLIEPGDGKRLWSPSHLMVGQDHHRVQDKVRKRIGRLE